MGSDEQVVSPDRLARPFESAAKTAVDGIGWCLEGQSFESTEYCFQLSGKPWRVFLGGSEAEFRRDDDARADLSPKVALGLDG